MAQPRVPSISGNDPIRASGDCCSSCDHLLRILKGIFIRVTAQKRIDIFHTAKILADRNILHSALMFIGVFCCIPRTSILLPGDTSLRAGQIDVHVCAFEFLNDFVHDDISKAVSRRDSEEKNLSVSVAQWQDLWN
jgi:hypothetical protein